MNAYSSPEVCTIYPYSNGWPIAVIIYNRFVIRDSCVLPGEATPFNKEWKPSESLINLLSVTEFTTAIVN